MRPASALLLCATAVLMAQQPIAVGPDRSANAGPGIAKFFDWYNGTASGCSGDSTHLCVGHTLNGDSYYWTAWMPNASGLPVTNGLPIVGTINDFSAPCTGGNLAILQLDAFNWSNPNASRSTVVNCMTSFGTSLGALDSPPGWKSHLTGSSPPDDGLTVGGWKSRAPFSKGGILYLPVERQVGSGAPSAHAATYIMSPDSGKHWCNPYTYFTHAGAPGCDSSNWKADGDAPLCAAPTSTSSCTDPGFLDSAHSSMMWKNFTAETFVWVNYGNQDGKPYPAGIDDGCDPAEYTCFMYMSASGKLARVPNSSSILDISAWQYYTCPAMTMSYRCGGTDPASWTSDLANATPVMYQTFSGGPYNGVGGFSNPYVMTYLKEFKSYISFGQGTDVLWAPRIQGPWTVVYRYMGGSIGVGNFLAASPAVGYNVIRTNPPHVQLTANSNSYLGGAGSPRFALFDLVLGRQQSGEAFQVTHTATNALGAGYQFTGGNIAGSFPRKGLVWSFDFSDLVGLAGGENWPYFLDRANYSVVLSPCSGGDYFAPVLCGTMNPGRGIALDSAGFSTTNYEYDAHLNTFRTDSNGFTTLAGAPAAMLANGSYSVVGVYRYNSPTPFHKNAGIWAAGTGGAGDNAAVSFAQADGRIVMGWNGNSNPRYQYSTNFTMTAGNWYFVAATVKAQTGCGSNCTPTVSIWVGGATAPGALQDVNAGIAYTAANSPTTKTPAVTAGPFVLGTTPTYRGQSTSGMSFASLMVYDRALTNTEVQFMYRSMRPKMAAKSVTLQ
ncbi:MAG: hypothetical protein ABI759_26115 [Candidatus Solibacter sp.]